MADRTFRYSPAGLPAHLAHNDDLVVFAGLYPAHHSWLCQHNIPFQVSGYYWPMLLAMLLHPAIDEEVCQMQLVIPAEHADAFAEFAGMQSD